MNNYPVPNNDFCIESLLLARYWGEEGGERELGRQRQITRKTLLMEIMAVELVSVEYP